MPEQNIKVSTNDQKLAHRARAYNIIKVLQNMSPISTHDHLSCNIPIVTTVIKGFHICSHQRIDDHYKKEKPYKKTNTSKKGKLE